MITNKGQIGADDADQHWHVMVACARSSLLWVVGKDESNTCL